MLSICLCAGADPVLPKLVDEVKIPDFKIEETGGKKTIKLPQLPEKPGMIPVLRCRMVSVGDAGCNYAARITFNDTPLGINTFGGRGRLLFRKNFFELNDPAFKGHKFPVFNGSNIMLIFAPDSVTGDKNTLDGMGAFFMFDISDAARAVDVNTVTFQNIRHKASTPITLLVSDAGVGYIRLDQLPRETVKLLQCKPSKQFAEVNGTRLDVFRNGGFAFTTGKCSPLVVETGLSTVPDSVSVLKAVEEKTLQPLSIKHPDTLSYLITVRWPDIQLERTLKISRDTLDWHEKWTNIGKSIAAVPFRYRIGLSGAKAHVWLRGTPDIAEFQTLCDNPTVFIESLKDPRRGYGIVLEDDILRLIAGAASGNGMAEIYSNTLALAPKTSRTFHYTVSGVSQNGYWEFINALRKRWGIGKYGVERPFFWNPSIPAVPGLSTEQRIQKALGHLGGITVILGPWFNCLSSDLRKADSRLKTTEARIADIQKQKKQAFAAKVAMYKKALPGAKIMSLHHPAMTAVYLPELPQSALADSVIHTRDGKPYHQAGYDQILLKGDEQKGWAVIYCLPVAGNAWWNQLLDDVKFSLSCGTDGVYFDEFSFCALQRDYSRYDYTEWDGFSADIDWKGKVTALKSDNAYTCCPFKSTLLMLLLNQDKLFLGNCTDVSRGMNVSPTFRFMEGTALVNMPAAHLSHVPLVFGNFGITNTREGVFSAVREALKYGGIYSPVEQTNLVLDGSDNFVCKLYPLTVSEIGPGFVVGRERLITEHSGTFNWPDAAGSEAELFIYDSKGNRIEKGRKVKIVSGRIELKVPEKGLVIAEAVNSKGK